MKHFAAIALLLSLCLSTRPARSQAVAPLPLLVVTLDSGTVVPRQYIGINAMAYQSIRIGRAIDQQLLAGQAGELRQLRAMIRHDSLTAAGMARALADCRQGWATTTTELNRQEVRTTKALALPSQKPLLLDGNTYKGGAAALVLYTVFKLFVHP